MPRTRIRRAAGFSLIELMMALAVVALMGGMVFVDYSSATTHERLKAAARRLAGYCEMIRAEAVSQSIACRIEFDFDRSRFRFVIDPPRDRFGRFVELEPTEDGEGRVLTEEELAERDESFEWEDLPRDVFLKRLAISAKEYYDKSVVSWPFWPDGSVAPFVIHLATAQGQVASVSMNGLTGTAEAVPDVLASFPEADASEFSSIMGNRPPGSGKQPEADRDAGRDAKDPGAPGQGRAR